MMALVFASLMTVAALVPAHFDEIANPADANYIPRPEWYLLSLFQLLKYFPGPLEPIATIVIPGVVFSFLFALPFLDRGAERHPAGPRRWYFTVAMLMITVGVGTLTILGLHDRPTTHPLDDWGLLPIAGLQLATRPDSTCARCHEPGGPAAPLSITRLSKDEEWLLSHMADPVAIAPGVRSAADPAPEPIMSRFQAQAVVAYLRRVRAGARRPIVSDEVKLAATTFANICVGCHKVSGEGGAEGPDLSHVGARRTAAEIREVIEDASLVYGETTMPTFRRELSAEQISALVNYLAARK
jgi:ubiquinol-cytochrome c reductase cytochrome b subunit